MNYFVAGLPRSRTAWLSVFLSQSGKYCFHEAINGCRSIEEYKKKLGGCGDSSTAHTLINIDKIYPESKIIIIDKSDEEIEKCIRWCDMTYGGDSRDIILGQSESLSKMRGQHISQRDIDNNLDFIFTYLTERPFFDEYLELSKFYIAVNDTSIDIEASQELMKSVTV